MKTLKYIITGIALLVLPGLALKGTEGQKQPILVLLHSRFDDHINMGVGEERLFRLITLVEKLRSEFSPYAINVSCELSGSFAQDLTRTPTGKGYLSRLQELAKGGWLDLGYIGENEPTYRTRPRAVFSKEMSAEERWETQTRTAEKFFNDYKDPLTGEPDSSRPGGLRAMREVLGEPRILGVFAPELGGEAPYYHQLRRMGIEAIMPGFPDPYFTMNIHGYRASAVEIGKSMVPVPEASSELFWDSNFLRASFTSSADMRHFYAEEGQEAFSKLMEKLDRSRVRLVQIEVISYERYLTKWPDGTPKLHPLTWAYEHPANPVVPSGIRAFVDTAEVDKAFAAEQQMLSWLLDEFLPANKGSRIVSAKDLLAMAQTPLGSTVSAGTLAEAARDWIARSKKEVNMSPTYVEAGGAYFSAADLFQLLANGLAGIAQNGKRPESVRLTHIYGPIALESTEETFPTTVISAREIARVAAELVPALNDQTWRPVPSNAVPVRVEIAGKRLIPAQFLALMVEAFLASTPDQPIRLRYFQPVTAPGYFFPRQNSISDGGHIWTVRPAPLKL